MQEIKYLADAAVRHGLVHDLLQFHRSDAEVQRCAGDDLEFSKRLSRDEGSQDRHQPISLVEVAVG